MGTENGELVGSFFAESLTDDEVVDLYVTSSEKIEEDKYLGYLLSSNRVVLSGVRGTGKTMILKTADVLIKKDLLHKLHYVNEWERDKRDYKVLPILYLIQDLKKK